MFLLPELKPTDAEWGQREISSMWLHSENIHYVIPWLKGLISHKPFNSFISLFIHFVLMMFSVVYGITSTKLLPSPNTHCTKGCWIVFVSDSSVWCCRYSFQAKQIVSVKMMYFISAIVCVCDVWHPLSIKPLCCSCTMSCYNVWWSAAWRKFCSLLWPLPFQKCVILYNVLCLLGFPTTLSYCASLL